MKEFLILFAALLVQISALAEIWKADPPHSRIAFNINHLGISDVTGLFKKFEVTVTSAQPTFSDALFELSIDTSSIDTEVDQRDTHLKSPDFFDVAAFPKLTFTRTAIKGSGKDRFKLTGNLTMHGVTKPVTMDLWYRGTTTNPMSKAITAGFQLTGTLKRSDFGIGPKFPAPLVGDEVFIKADGEFIKQ